ncbi:MAG: N-6 DNA methylase [Planctomycetales bacterium]|nr:N-6 DNA methylase [Planctomycetales bacterium]
MAKKKTKEVVTKSDTQRELPLTVDDGFASIEDGKIVDYITGKQVKESGKETVRQRIARAIFHEYGFSPDDMEPDFPVKVNGRRKKIDIAIFRTGSEHEEENLHRVVICKPEPKQGKKGAFKLRDHEQATKDLDELKDFMEAIESCQWGLWTNGMEFFFVKKEQGRFEADFKPMGDWPLADESMGTKEVHSHAKLRRADPELLRITFRRCHNFIHGNEGMSKDAAFWQFLYLIFAKMHDERQTNGDRRFWVAPNERFDEAGQAAIRKRFMPLFKATVEEFKGDKYGNIFRGNEEITLSDRALAFMVSELAKYSFSRTDTDAKGAAYQEIVGDTLRGDRGQFFTPSNAVKLMVEMLAPKEDERVIDPACGTGGFLRATLAFLIDEFHKETGTDPDKESTEEFNTHQKRLKAFAKKYLFGADFDPSLVRASQMNVVMACNQMANIYHMNSLEFPDGNLSGVEYMKKKAKLGSMDVVMTNPPFGADIPVTDPNILKHFDLAYKWERVENGGFRRTETRHGSVAPEILFIERCLQWLRPGGRMGIVLPNGILGNPGDEYIRWWVLRHAYILASVDLPVEGFIVEANVNISTSLVFLKKKTDDQISAEELSGRKDYPVFMAVPEKVGYDRRGNTLYERSPEGVEVLRETASEERVRVGGEWVLRTLKRKERVIDDHLPLVADEYRKFRGSHPEPGR